MELDIIFTFNKRIPSQERVRIPVRGGWVDSFASFCDHALSLCDEGDVPLLHKVSVCVMASEVEAISGVDPTCPKWLEDIGGKIFFDNGIPRRPVWMN